MATPVIMPRQGNTVESCLILEWKKHPGDTIAEGEVLCTVETDKAVFEVESPAGGILLESFFTEGEDVPVLMAIAAVGSKGEDVSSLRPTSDGAEAAAIDAAPSDAIPGNIEGQTPGSDSVRDLRRISPRARRLAREKSVAIDKLTGTGPGGRIIEKDVREILEGRPPLTPAAAAEARTRGIERTEPGAGIGGRITLRDIADVRPEAVPPEGGIQEIPVTGIRRLIADRMLASLRGTAQLTLNTAADATAILDYRKLLKTRSSSLSSITINHLLLFAVSRVLRSFPQLNALMQGDVIRRFERVHLAFAVDTDRGLMVPVIRDAHLLGLQSLAEEAVRLTDGCLSANLSPDALQGGTFTVTNLGQLGIESFTPILNPPQVAILGVGSVQLKPVQADGQVVFRPYIGLSLTINHQAVDGSPAGRFLKALCGDLAEFSLLLAR